MIKSALLTLGLLGGFGGAIAKQFIRERLISRLLEKREYALDVSSDWTFSSRMGYANAIKKESIWGADGRAMMQYPALRKLILAARVADVAQNCGVIACVVSFILFFYFQ